MDGHCYLPSTSITQHPAGLNTACTELNENQIKFEEMSKLIQELQTQSAVVLLRRARHFSKLTDLFLMTF
jgi:hypothetical protein